MEKEKIYDKINSTKSVDQLKLVIQEVFGENGMIHGRTEPFSVPEMLVYIDQFEEDFPEFIKGNGKFRSLPTRSYGIRQQLCMILLNPTR